MDAPLTPPRPLTAIVVTGTRRWIREGLRWFVVAMMALTGLVLATARHQVCDSWDHCDADDWSALHTIWHDLGPVPFVMLAAAIGLTVWARRWKMIGGLIASFLTTAVLFVLLLALALTHFLSSVRGDEVTIIFVLPALVGAFVQLCAEPIITARERAVAAQRDPHLARAQLLRRG